MAESVEALFLRFRRTGDPECLGRVFDRVAPRLLSVALHLGREPAAAEDLLQATFLTAIERADSFDELRPLVPWLHGILVRHARKLAADRHRRPAPERVPSRTPGEDPAAAAERSELAGLLREKVELLPDPMRQALLLKLLHGLEPAEIAEVLNVPPGTVRMRLHRGLARLRAMLPPGAALGVLGVAFSIRGLRAVRAAVLAQAAMPSPVAVATVGGALVMKKAILALGGLALCLWLVWPDSADAELAPPGHRNGARGDAAPLRIADSRAEEGADAQALRRGIVGSAAASETAAAAGGDLHVRVVRARTEQGVPHVGAEVMPLDGRDPTAHRRRVHSDQDGSFTVSGLPAGPVRVRLDRGVEQVAEIEAGGTTEIVLSVPLGVTVRGRVVDAAGGAVPRAELRVWRNVTRGGNLAAIGLTDAFGEFELLDLAPNVTWIGATAPGHAPSLMHPVRGEPGGEQEIVLRMQGAGGVLAGRVVDRDGAPVAGAIAVVGEQYGAAGRHVDARTWLAPPQPEELRTDDNGEFVAVGLGSGFLEVRIQAAGMAPFSEFVELQPAAVRRATFVVERGATLVGRVRAPDGRGVARAAIRVEGYGPREVRDTVTARDGTFRLDGVCHGRIAVSVHAEGFAPEQAELHGESGQEVSWEVTLRPEPVLRGRLVDAADRALARWRVAPSGRPSRWRRTDAEGRFAVSGFPDRMPARLSVALPGSMGWYPVVDLPDPIPEEEIVVRVPDLRKASCAVRGTIVDGAGRPFAVAWVVLETQTETGAWRYVGGCPPDPETGAFRIGPLPPGRYALNVRIASVILPQPQAGPRDLLAGEQWDVGTLRLPATGSARFHLRRSDGQRILDPRVYVYADGVELGSVTVDAGGRGEGKLLPGRYTARVMCNNAEWRRREFAVRASEVTVVELELQPAIRRYVSFPVPTPADWGAPQRVEFALRDATGHVLDSWDWEPRQEMPFRYMPSFAVGEYSLDLITDAGKRYRGTFRVDDLFPSYVPILVSVR